MVQRLSMGELLEQARVRQGRSVRGLATDVDVSPRYMRDLLYGSRVPSERVIISLSNVLGLSYHELMMRAGRVGETVEKHVQRSRPYGVYIRKLADDMVTDNEVAELLHIWESMLHRRRPTEK